MDPVVCDFIFRAVFGCLRYREEPEDHEKKTTFQVESNLQFPWPSD